MTRRLISNYRLAMFFLRHPRSLEVRAWKHKQIKQQNCACYVGCYSSKIVSWITWLYRWYWLADVFAQFEQCAYASAVYIPYQFSIKLKFAPWFQTAGIGVFAGRAFKKDEIILRSSMTLFLPRNIPGFQTLLCYGFGHNETHLFLDLDYGSIINHHESANAAAMRVNSMYYRVRGFLMCESQC